ncbi:hypothetical protein ACMD2_19325 [Ananas comosus]|uniref:Uncharacterized protein n=1 Tax=Ananas comosus TaxID=4615 RepID=A0A199W511_ANACO|nr:hypothetical protein ACMD2_19325 [Ananas comosus]
MGALTEKQTLDVSAKGTHEGWTNGAGACMPYAGDILKLKIGKDIKEGRSVRASGKIFDPGIVHEASSSSLSLVSVPRSRPTPPPPPSASLSRSPPTSSPSQPSDSSSTPSINGESAKISAIDLFFFGALCLLLQEALIGLSSSSSPSKSGFSARVSTAGSSPRRSEPSTSALAAAASLDRAASSSSDHHRNLRAEIGGRARASTPSFPTPSKGQLPPKSKFLIFAANSLQQDEEQNDRIKTLEKEKDRRNRKEKT